ncbi:type VI secretion system contractile sheath small subunit [Thalassobacter stenotrophicus]|jgi:type VI secretion system protein ImpB|uniref:type VI secretion system contractile sheath small subunit n=1 Tax=Thalassobacter stenotrophicus TaxID=266809 RepID=UPI000D5C8ADD|nr:type VI secretion system contractile sheath small subunit [Thalassobacter stenotrophicus]PVZ48398.1 type VI secretion system contractile sheath small subunit [Thalassobacter stenotrophicus]QPI85330.1 type VI secretion system contractile sheath small subunit [Rhodobacterales bacterium HKCCA1288]
MALNAQQKRVSKNRVSITYDVEDGGSMQKKELPFIIGMIGGYSGDREDKEDLEDRTFYTVDKDNFNDVMTRVGPKLSFTVENKIQNDGSEFQVELDFKSMKDFEPDAIVDKVEPLRNLAATREKLMTLVAKADRSRDLEKVLKEILQDADMVKALGEELGVSAENKGE